MSIPAFSTDLSAIHERISRIDPVSYGKTRNFEAGDVTYLSPYISRGVISTKQVYHQILERGLAWKSIEKLVQELAWRDYWQQVWIAKGDEIDKDLKRTQEPIDHHDMCDAVQKAQTGIEAVDRCINSLYSTGYMHNHMRMYVAAITCNMARAHWHSPARWMYYHLLDGDWASNALSWQWVAGSNAGKKYVANQQNINKYFSSQQRGTFIDIPYEDFEEMPVPTALAEHSTLDLLTPLPQSEPISLDPTKECLLYTYYNLDPDWHSNVAAERILILEPLHFGRYPVGQRCIEFALGLAENINGIKVFVGEFAELQSAHPESRFVYKEHPTNRHFEGREEPRDWMFDVTGYHSSFFAFWKKCQKQIQH